MPLTPGPGLFPYHVPYLGLPLEALAELTAVLVPETQSVVPWPGVRVRFSWTWEAGGRFRF